MAQLSDEEHSDLWATARAVQKRVEAKHGSDSANVAVQDGLGAGQSVPHVHIHILPRQRGDLPEDAIYEAIEGWHPWAGERQGGAKMEMPEQRFDRTTEMMAAEAAEYKSLF